MKDVHLNHMMKPCINYNQLTTNKGPITLQLLEKIHTKTKKKILVMLVPIPYLDIQTLLVHILMAIVNWKMV